MIIASLLVLSHVMYKNNPNTVIKVNYKGELHDIDLIDINTDTTPPELIMVVK